LNGDLSPLTPSVLVALKVLLTEGGAAGIRIRRWNENSVIVQNKGNKNSSYKVKTKI